MKHNPQSTIHRQQTFELLKSTYVPPTAMNNSKPTTKQIVLLKLTVLLILLISNHPCLSETIRQCTSDDESNHQCKEEDLELKQKLQLKWDIDAKHRCNIKKLSYRDLHKKFKHGLPPLHHEPIILYRTSDDYKENIFNRKCDATIFSNMMSFENITKTFDEDFKVTLSSSNSFSAHRRTISLSNYLEESMKEEILPSDLSNMTWYLFGETYSKEWKDVLAHYCLPPCQTCTSELSALSFGVGGKGSGVQWHVHGPGFSESIFGKKHWVLYPPEEKPSYDPDYTSRHWMEEIYTILPQSSLPYECTLLPGEMIYFPDSWHHATINLSKYTAFISTFTTEHGFASKE